MRGSLFAACIVIAGPAVAQDTPDQGVLAGFLQDSLSSAGRSVEIFGFEGALSSQASIERLTISDDSGIWLVAEGLTLDWNRGALLRGAVDVSDLSANRIQVLRRPIVTSDPSLPVPEATPFALPDLPVSIEVDNLVVNELDLASDILGQSVLAKLEGTTSLSGGAGQATLALRRMDGSLGSILLNGQYDNATTALNLDLRVEEQAGGIAASLLGVPDTPSVDLSLQAEGTLANLTAVLDLDTNAMDRVDGTVTLATDDLNQSRFDANLSGDIATLVAPEYRPFFGPNMSITANGLNSPETGFELSAFDLTADQMTLNGRVSLAPDGWPTRLDISGEIRGDGAVALPFGDGDITVDAATLNAQFDASLSPEWTANFRVDQFTTTGLTIPDLEVAANGVIAPETSGFDGRIRLAAQGVDWADTQITTAIGDSFAGAFEVAYQPDLPLRITNIDLAGPDLALNGDLSLDTAGAEPALTLDIAANAARLDRFAGLIGQPISGDISTQIAGRLQPLSQRFDLTVQASSERIAIGQTYVDRFLTDGATLSGQFARDLDGTRIRDFSVDAANLTARADATLTSQTSDLTLTAQVADASAIDPALTGALSVSLTANRGADGAFDALLDATNRDDTLTLTAVSADGILANISANLGVAELAAYAGLIGQQLAGQIAADVGGTVDLDALKADVTVSANGRNLGTGVSTVDTLLVGNGSLSASLTASQSALTLSSLSLTFPRLNGSATAEIADGAGVADFDMRVTDLSGLAPDFSGPLSASGSATLDTDQRISFDVQADGPGGLVVQSRGSTQQGRIEAKATGAAPLALLNEVIAPRRIGGTAEFDLAINGAAEIGNVSGTVTLANGAVSAPTLSQSLTDLSAQVRLSGGNAAINATAVSTSGGELSVDGTIGLNSLGADLQIAVRDLGLQDPTLYRTTVDADAQVIGPLTGGALIRGQVTLGPTEVRVPSSDISTLGTLPDVTHIGASADVRATLDRAGLLRTATDSASGRPFDLNLSVNAPSRIFVRGRGLDAELGGQLVITGNTNDIITTGQFDLIRGRLDILQQRFDLTEGAAIIQGDLIPNLRLVAQTEARTGTIVNITVSGPADAPEVAFSSSPDLPQDEVLAQLLFGRDVSSISALQAIQLASAVNTLAGRGGDGIIGSVRNAIDVDDLDITTDDAGNAAVRAGKYIGENVYTDLTITSEGDTEINLNLDLTDDITAKGSFASDGETSLGIFFERDY